MAENLIVSWALTKSDAGSDSLRSFGRWLACRQIQRFQSATRNYDPPDEVVEFKYWAGGPIILLVLKMSTQPRETKHTSTCTKAWSTGHVVTAGPGRPGRPSRRHPAAPNPSRGTRHIRATDL
jgi:hypothetical protein